MNLRIVGTVTANCGAIAEIELDNSGDRLPYHWKTVNKAGQEHVPASSGEYWFATQNEAVRSFLKEADGYSNF